MRSEIDVKEVTTRHSCIGMNKTNFNERTQCISKGRVGFKTSSTFSSARIGTRKPFKDSHCYESRARGILVVGGRIGKLLVLIWRGVLEVTSSRTGWCCKDRYHGVEEID